MEHKVESIPIIDATTVGEREVCNEPLFARVVAFGNDPKPINIQGWKVFVKGKSPSIQPSDTFC